MGLIILYEKQDAAHEPECSKTLLWNKLYI